MSILVQQSPVLVLKEREVLNRLEVNQHQIVAQEDGVVHQLAVITEDVVAPTLWVHDACQAHVLLLSSLVVVCTISLGKLVLDPHAVALSKWNLAYCIALDVFEVLLMIKFLKYS